MVSATGKVVPQKEASLSVAVGGNVEQVLVSKGENVHAGQVLVKLEASQAQIAAVSAAELELLNAQLALEALNKNLELQAAQALNSAETAARALEDLNNPDLQQARASQSIADAQKAVDVAERDLEILTKPPTQNTIEQAKGNLLLADKKHHETIDQIEDLQRQFKNYSADKNIPAAVKQDILTKIKKALKGLEVKRSLEQLALEGARTRLDELLSPADPLDVQLAETNLAVAQAMLSDAEREYERVTRGPEAGEVALLEAQIEKGQRDYETYRFGPDPKDLALAESRIDNAEAQLAAAQEAIADRELVAPFDGVISEIDVNSGEWVAPGRPLIQIGNLDQLQVETTDLGEKDVARIEIGDHVMITFDSLPDLALQGKVTRIAPKSDDGAGVNFPVIIKLDQVPDMLRWGMTAFVDIAIEQEL
jgi:RND family efflux transporter MFP subunit